LTYGSISSLTGNFKWIIKYQSYDTLNDAKV